MTDFRTILPPPDFDFSLTHQDIILSMGSCFAEHIGQRMANYKFASILNPFGIMYNPVSISTALHHLLSGKDYQASDLFFHQELWHSFDHHGAFSNADQELMLSQINENVKRVGAMLKKMTCLIVTLGTANVYVHKNSDRVVANCHKLPGQDFYRKMLSPEDIVAQLGGVLSQIKKLSPKLNVLLTVSPVRHIRDGLVENNQSKARLLLAVEKMVGVYDWVHYFPAYELIIDDLRDYRFFNNDLVHPSDMAIDYVWEYFANAFFPVETKELNKSIEKIIRASQHRPFHAESSAHQIFLQKQLLQISGLEKAFPSLNFEKERHIFETQFISKKE